METVKSLYGLITLIDGNGLTRAVGRIIFILLGIRCTVLIQGIYSFISINIHKGYSVLGISLLLRERSKFEFKYYGFLKEGMKANIVFKCESLRTI